ncbi:hypothetical protein EON81_17455 [bacterium]|nr:MAG: hypothetical protein EON81_17455 [bacterium]
MKRTRSELERYLDGMVISLRIQSAKRPEEWFRWGGLVLFVLVGGFFGYPLALLVLLLALVGQVWLTRRRLGVIDSAGLMTRSLEESAPTYVRRALRKGKLDEQVGPEARSILESCATLANSILLAAAKVYMVEGGGMTALKAFKPITGSTETLMKSALHLVSQDTMFRQKPTAETLDRLREIETSLKLLVVETEEMASQHRTPSNLSLDATATIEAIKAREELKQGQ